MDRTDGRTSARVLIIFFNVATSCRSCSGSRARYDCDRCDSHIRTGRGRLRRRRQRWTTTTTMTGGAVASTWVVRWSSWATAVWTHRRHRSPPSGQALSRWRFVPGAALAADWYRHRRCSSWTFGGRPSVFLNLKTKTKQKLIRNLSI